MSCLVVTSGSAKGRTFQVSPGRDHLVGRLAECNVCIIDPQISRRHCLISSGQTGYTVKDLGSANGVHRNGQRVSEAVLKDGDRLRLGCTEMEFHLTERFEDAETKRLAPGERAVPDLDRPAQRSPQGMDTQAQPVEFCSRCSGSVPAGALAAGKAERIGDELVCTECLARERAAAEAAGFEDKFLVQAEAGRKGAGPKADADEVARLAAEVAEGAEKGQGPGQLYESAPLEADEVIEVNGAGLPKLSGEGGGRMVDEDADTPRPSSEIRVL